MLREAYHRRMIDIYNFLSQAESIHGDVDLFVRFVEKSLSHGKKLEQIAKSEDDLRVARATIEMNELILSVLQREVDIEDFKEKLWEIEKKYPEVFARGRRDIGTPEEAVRAIIHKVEYMVNRYDVRYPLYDMHKCSDR